MTDLKEVEVQQLGFPDSEDEELTTGATRHSAKAFGFPVIPGFSRLAGYLGRDPISMVLMLPAFVLLSGLLVGILVQVSNMSRIQEVAQEQERSAQQKLDQDLALLKVGVDRLCFPCPWEWTFFQGNCYFFSKSQNTWQNSVTACKNIEAQLVIIKSDQEENFLKVTSQPNSWIGLSDLHQEATWHWVDGSPLSSSFKKYWNDGEPNNIGEEDCVEFKGNGWNDSKCDKKNFWICKKTAVPCSTT